MAHFPSIVPSAVEAMGVSDSGSDHEFSRVFISKSVDSWYSLVEATRSFARPHDSTLELGSITKYFSKPRLVKFGFDDTDFCQVQDMGLARRVSFSNPERFFTDTYRQAQEAAGIKPGTRPYWTLGRANVNNASRVVDVLSNRFFQPTMFRMSELPYLFRLEQHRDQASHGELLRMNLCFQVRGEQSQDRAEEVVDALNAVYAR